MVVNISVCETVPSSLGALFMEDMLWSVSCEDLLLPSGFCGVRIETRGDSAVLQL